MDPWKAACVDSTNGLTTEEKRVFLNTQPEDILNHIARLDRENRKSRKLRRSSTRLQPLLAKLEDYGKALDTIANSSPLVLPSLWGSLRLLLIAAYKYSDYFSKLLTMLEQIADVLPRSSVYSQYLHYEPLQEKMQATYSALVSFLTRARKFFTKSSTGLVLISLWKSFDKEFGTVVDEFRELGREIDNDASAAADLLLFQEVQQGKVAKEGVVTDAEVVETPE
ncbi:hypothetical protein BDV96DRAFT_37850 [Lophiotrema nucula]|uniref:DUF7708 domain-containing protein n=1 Tax=Lophiotrema nucula TaxID=690887 RepID=A0A6A5ZEX0_9PLEO|nr:hypothetical protein BDV96DRAFT_37850 [Lophiotrema nucula]